MTTLREFDAGRLDMTWVPKLVPLPAPDDGSGTAL